MRWLVDVAYILAAVLTLPAWLPRMLRTGRHRTDWRGRFGMTAKLPAPHGRRVLIHAVSVGEVNAVRHLVELLRSQGIEPVISVTTDTGFARAISLWKNLAIVRFPFDLSICVNRFLSAVQPHAVALVELEVWPNFVAACDRRGIPVCVINGRLTERSARRYRWVKPLMKPAFARLRKVGVQNDAYAQRFVAMGASRDAIATTGTMKWDTAEIADHVAGAEELAADLGIDRGRPLVVAGSTAPGEHELLAAALPQGVQLLCAPRRPEWFDLAAAAMPGCVRRSHSARPSRRASASNGQTFYLLDTIGELRQAYALADVVVVGRSFGGLHGSDMMEPVALGKATVVGPAVSDFQSTVDALLGDGGLIQTSAAELPRVLRELLHDAGRRQELAAQGRAVIRANQGATARNVAIITESLNITYCDSRS